MLNEIVSWEHAIPIVPPPTRLYHLPPIGIGTPMVESLTGYIARLAEAHCVSAAVLYQKEIKPIASTGNIFTFQVSCDEGYSTQAINGVGSTAASFVRSLEELTGRHDLRYLTLLTWKHVLDRVALLRRSRSWCESCFYAWHNSGQEIYEPPLWTLQAVTVCPYHRRPLCQVCPHCRKMIGPLDPRSRPGYCSRCSQTLVPKTVALPLDLGLLSKDAEDWANWIVSTLGELLAMAPRVGASPEKRQIAAIIRLCVDETTSGNASAFGRLMHTERGSVIRWEKGVGRPRLSVLLNIAYCRGISLAELVCESPSSIASRAFLRPPLAKAQELVRQTRARASWRVDTTEVLENLNAALNEDPPPSLTRAIRRLNCTEVTARRHFPELCFKLARRYAEYRVKQAMRRKTLAADEVRRVASDLQAKGIKLTRTHLRPLLSSSDYLNLVESKAVLDELRGGGIGKATV